MKEKSVSEAIKFRRSVRIYNPKKSINSNLVKKCIEQALLSPSSSNLQLWEFYHIKSENFLKNVVRICFNQPAAKTAQELVIPVVRLDLWPERINSNVNFIKSSNKGKDKEKIKGAIDYYQKAIPKLYRGSKGLKSFFNHLKTYYRGLKKVTLS